MKLKQNIEISRNRAKPTTAVFPTAVLPLDYTIQRVNFSAIILYFYFYSLLDFRWGTKDNHEYFAHWYVALYEGTVMKACLELDPWRPFVGSSPSNGAESEREGWLSSDPQDPHYGDLHTYIYDSDRDLWHPDTYPLGRFVTEFGVLAPAALSTWRAAGDPTAGDWNTQSEFFQHRVHSPGGVELMQKFIQTKFKPAASFPFDTLELVRLRALIVIALLEPSQNLHSALFSIYNFDFLLFAINLFLSINMSGTSFFKF